MDDNGIRNKVQVIANSLAINDDHPKAKEIQDRALFAALELIAEALVDLKRAAMALERIATALEPQVTIQVI